MSRTIDNVVNEFVRDHPEVKGSREFIAQYFTDAFGIGHDAGYQDGYDQGYTAGKDDGYQDGYDAGWDNARDEDWDYYGLV